MSAGDNIFSFCVKSCHFVSPRPGPRPPRSGLGSFLKATRRIGPASGSWSWAAHLRLPNRTHWPARPMSVAESLDRVDCGPEAPEWVPPACRRRSGPTYSGYGAGTRRLCGQTPAPGLDTDALGRGLSVPDRHLPWSQPVPCPAWLVHRRLRPGQLTSCPRSPGRAYSVARAPKGRWA